MLCKQIALVQLGLAEGRGKHIYMLDGTKIVSDAPYGSKRLISADVLLRLAEVYGPVCINKILSGLVVMTGGELVQLLRDDIVDKAELIVANPDRYISYSWSRRSMYVDLINLVCDYKKYTHMQRKAYNVFNMILPAKFDTEFWDGGYTVTSWIKAGGSIQDLGLDIPKNRWKDILVHPKANVITPMDLAYQWPVLLGYPEEWINESPKSYKVFEWSMSHLEKLKGSKVIYGPKNTQMTLHYHSLVRYIRPEDVPSVKTSWDKVIRALEEREAEKMKARLGENIQFAPWKGKPTPSGITYIPDTKSLIAEGERMHHCVGGYADFCINGDGYYGCFSLKNSTAEVEVIDGKLKVHQHRAVNNAIPSVEDKNLLNRWIKS